MMEQLRHPSSRREIINDYTARRKGLLTALTSEAEDFYMECNPDKQYLCLHGKSDSSWQVTLPADQVPSELPEPTIGINFAR
jgi:hypothetical protein